MSTPVPVPEGIVAKRTLQFFWIADHSGSMSGKKIATLNQAIREALPAIRAAVSAYPEVAIMMRAIKFSDNAEWHVGPAPVPIDQFVWPELNTAGGTATAQAIRLLTTQMTTEKMPGQNCPPVCILISDGFCTDAPETYAAAIADLVKLPFGKRAVRLAIAVGDPADYSESELLGFVSHPEIGVLKADTPQKLVNHIRWASVAGSIGATVGKSKAGAGGSEFVALAAPPADQPVLGSSGQVEAFDGFVEPK